MKRVKLRGEERPSLRLLDEYTPELRVPLPDLVWLFAEQLRAEHDAENRAWFEREFGWIERALTFIQPWTPLPPGEDLGVVEQTAAVRGFFLSEADAQVHFPALGLRWVRVCGLLCYQLPLVAMRAPVIEDYVSAGAPIYLARWLERALGRFRCELTPSWARLLSNEFILASRRVYTIDDTYWFLTFASQAIEREGLVDLDRLDDDPWEMPGGWAPVLVRPPLQDLANCA